MLDPAAELHAAFVALASFPSAKVYKFNNGWACGVSVGPSGHYVEARGKTPAEAIRKAIDGSREIDGPLEGQLALFGET